MKPTKNETASSGLSHEDAVLADIIRVFVDDFQGDAGAFFEISEESLSKDTQDQENIMVKRFVKTYSK